MLQEELIPLQRQVCEKLGKTCLITVAIQSGSYRAQKSPQGRKNEKNYEKITKSPTQPKIRKNYRKNTKTVIFGPFLHFFFGNFFVFSGRNPGWGFCIFICFFFVFPALGVLCPVQARRNCKITDMFSSLKAQLGGRYNWIPSSCLFLLLST